MRNRRKLCAALAGLVLLPTAAMAQVSAASGELSIEQWSARVAAQSASCRSTGTPDYDAHVFRDMTLAHAFRTVADKDRAAPKALELALHYLVSTPIPLARGGFQQTSLWKLDLRGVHLFFPNLAHGYFSNADFTGAEIVSPDFCNANLQNAHLEDVVMWQADFSGAYLLGTGFTGADLPKARFDGATLRRTDFSNANLREARFGKVDMAKVGLSGADISGVDFSGTSGLTQAQVDSACHRPHLGAPRLPAGLGLPPACP